jgi:hypothetical protein
LSKFACNAIFSKDELQDANGHDTEKLTSSIGMTFDAAREMRLRADDEADIKQEAGNRRQA